VPAFFTGDDLAPDLVAEARELGITVKGYNVKNQQSLAPLLQDLQATHPLFDFSAREAFELEQPAADSTAAVAPWVIAPIPPGPQAAAPTPELASDDVQGVVRLLAQAQ